MSTVPNTIAFAVKSHDEVTLNAGRLKTIAYMGKVQANSREKPELASNPAALQAIFDA